MSKKSSKVRKEEKLRRVRAERRARLMRRLPWYAVGLVAIGVVVALFVIGVGSGGSGSVAAQHPPGYEPPIIGDPDAPVEMVMWGDFQCPFCRRFELQTLIQLKQRYFDTGQVVFVWRNFENYGRESRDSAVAAYCAGEQDKFWEYHDALYRNQGGINDGAFSTANLRRLAEELELNLDAFNSCLDSSRYDAVLSADKQLGRNEFGVNATPTFFINNLRVVGAQPTETFVSIIEEALQRSGR